MSRDSEIKDLAVSLSAIYQPTALTPAMAIGIQGPHRWDEMAPADFGPKHDFELQSHQTQVIFDPISEAALQWCYAHLPEDCPRFGTRAFMIEAENISAVVRGANRDGLMSMADYFEAMEEASNQAVQGEER